MVQDPNHSDSSNPVQAAPTRAVRGRRASRYLRIVVSMLLLSATVGGLIGWWVWSRFHIGTDNAYVVGNITPVSSEISGKVVALYADDNMIVKAGDPSRRSTRSPGNSRSTRPSADLGQLQAQERAPRSACD